MTDAFSYDAYGVMLGGNPTRSNPAATSLLYAGEHFDTDAQQYYLRARWYNPLNGRFNRTDPFAGNTQDPQSLHKYLYAHCNPINNVDPSGEFATVTEVQVTTAIQIDIGMSIAVNVLLLRAIWDADSALKRSFAKQEIELFIQSSPEPLTQTDFDALENRIKARTRSRDKELLYLHYSFRDIAHIFRTLGGLKAPSWCTRTVYPTGWYAKYYLAMYQGPPRNSIYIVLPDKNSKIFGPNAVNPEVDRYMPGVLLKGSGIMGQGMQWYFPHGTGPGTVFGPIPIPEGNLEDVR